MTITTKTAKNGTTIYYADGKRVAKAIAIEIAKQNNINIIDANTVDTESKTDARATYLKDIETNVKNAYAAMIAAEESAPPYAPANRPVQTYATKYVHSVLCYFDKATGKQITEAQARKATVKNAFKQITATFKQYGKITERDAQDSTVTVSVDSYEKAIGALNGVAKIFTGKAPFEWSTSDDIRGIYHAISDSDHEIKIYERVRPDGSLSIDIWWIYYGEEPETDGIYTIDVAPVPNTPEPNGGNDKGNGNNDSDSDNGNGNGNDSGNSNESSYVPSCEQFNAFIDGESTNQFNRFLLDGGLIDTNRNITTFGKLFKALVKSAKRTDTRNAYQLLWINLAYRNNTIRWICQNIRLGSNNRNCIATALAQHGIDDPSKILNTIKDLANLFTCRNARDKYLSVITNDNELKLPPR